MASHMRKRTPSIHVVPRKLIDSTIYVTPFEPSPPLSGKTANLYNCYSTKRHQKVVIGQLIPIRWYLARAERFLESQGVAVITGVLEKGGT